MTLAYGRDAVALLMRRQTTDFNTPEAAGSGKFAQVQAYRAPIGSRRDLFEDRYLGDGRNPGEVLLGFERADGEIEAPLRSESIGWHLYGLFGAPATTGDGEVPEHFSHVFTSAGAMTHWTMGYRAGETWFRDAGMTYNEMRFRLARASETQRMSFGLIGRNEEKLGAALDAAPVEPVAATDLRMFAFDATMTLDGSPAADIVDMDLTISQGRTLDEEAISGQPYPLRVLEGDLTISGTARFRFEDATRYDLAAATTEFDMSVIWTAGTQSFTLAIQNLVFAKDSVRLDSGGVLSLSLPLRASRATSGPSITATLVNRRADYANPA